MSMSLSLFSDIDAERDESSALSHRAEIFRSKLIEDFQILESTSEQGKRKVPTYSTTDIISNCKL